jgi:hypothetical protein
MRFVAVILVTVLLIGALLTFAQWRPHQHPSASDRRALVAAALTKVDSFVSAEDHSTGQPFTVTYKVTGSTWAFLYTGFETISYAPKDTGRVVPPKLVAVNGMGRYGYVFREADQNIVQWILDGSSVSWCLKIPSIPRAKLAHLECTGPHPYIASNGYAIQSQPFIPTTALTNVTYTWPGSTPLPTFTKSRSSVLGAVHCMTEFGASSQLTTCIDSSGFLASTNWRSSDLWSRATAVSWRNYPDGSVLTTLARSTMKYPTLPPV